MCTDRQTGIDDERTEGRNQSYMRSLRAYSGKKTHNNHEEGGCVNSQRMHFKLNQDNRPLVLKSCVSADN